MSTTLAENGRCYCGRVFNPADIDRIRAIISDDPLINRAQISRKVCEVLQWYKRDGGLKEMSCRVALLRMHRDQLIVLPPARKRNGNGKMRVPVTASTDPPEKMIIKAASEMDTLRIEWIDTREKSRLWNEYIARYHYLGYTPLPGAQLRFFVYSNETLLACMGFGAAAWKVAPRDTFIQWEAHQRTRNLHLIVNNARFLILPWVKSSCLASKILSMARKQIPLQWKKRYGYQPVLFETFVESNRFKGTCYRAANWIHLGRTTGRGKKDTKHENSLPIKDVFVYPLKKNFRQRLHKDEI